MAEGSSQTIDRIQVEIAVNSGEVISNLESISASAEATKGELSSLETGSCKTADCVKELGSTVASSAEELQKYPSAVKDSESSLKGLDSTVKVLTKTTGKATDATESFKDNVDNITKPVDNIKKGISKLSELMKFTGVAAAASVAFGIIKSRIEEVQSAAHQAYTQISNMESSLSAMSGGLSETDKAIISAIAPTSTNSASATSLQTKIKQTQGSDLSVDTNKRLLGAFETAATQMNMNASELYSMIYSSSVKMGESTDAESLITKASAVSQIWQDTGVDVSNAFSSIDEYSSDLKETGLSLLELFQSAAESYKKTQSTSQYESIFESVGTQSKAAYTAAIAKYSGESDPEKWLSEQSVEDQVKYTTIAEKAAAESLISSGSEIKSGLATLDFADAERNLTSTKFTMMSSSDLGEYAGAVYNQVTEDGKQNVYEYGESIDEIFNDTLRNLLTAYEYGEISAEEFAKEYQIAIKTHTSAVGSTWADIGSTLLGTNNKTSADYVNTAYDYYSHLLNGPYVVNDTKGGTIPEFSRSEDDTSEALYNKLMESSSESIWDKILGLLGIGKASAADDVVFNQDWNGMGKSQTEAAAEQFDTKDAAEGMEDLGKAAEEASGVLAPLTTDVLVPMNTELATQGTNLTYNYDATVLLNDTSTNVTVPTVQTETTYVAALAQEYWNLYYAKLAAASV